MKDFYSEFVKYAIQTCSKEDYYYKSRVWKNNRAVTKIRNISLELINSDKEKAGELLGELMKHDNEKVRLFASSVCLQYNIDKEIAKQVLKEIVTDSQDSIISFNAEMTLECWH